MLASCNDNYPRQSTSCRSDLLLCIARVWTSWFPNHLSWSAWLLSGEGEVKWPLPVGVTLEKRRRLLASVNLSRQRAARVERASWANVSSSVRRSSRRCRSLVCYQRSKIPPNIYSGIVWTSLGLCHSRKGEICWFVRGWRSDGSNFFLMTSGILIGYSISR